MKYSIIIPFYNAEKYLSECIESILNQTYKNFELILVNDGSTDSSAKICEKFQSISSNIFLYNQENKGVSSARNFGIKNATGDMIVFIDSDDVCNEKMLDIINKKVSKNAILVFGYGKWYKNCIINVVNVDNKVKLNRKNLNFMYDFFSDNYYGGFLWNKVFEKKIIDKFNIRFCENLNFCEDMVFVSDYLDHIEKIKYIDKNLYLYRQRKSSVSNNLLTKKNSNIVFAYDLLYKKYNNNLNLAYFFGYRYLICYYKFKKFISKNKVNNEILKLEKSILSKKSFSEKIKFLIIKHFHLLYYFTNKNKNVKNLFD